MVVEHDSEEEEEEEEEADGSGAEEEEQEDRRARRAREKRERIRWNAIAVRAAPLSRRSPRPGRRRPGGLGPRRAPLPSTTARVISRSRATRRLRRESSRRRRALLLPPGAAEVLIRNEGATRLPLSLRVHAINAMSIEGDLIARDRQRAPRRLHGEE